MGREPIKVMIVDDAVVVRKIITDTLSTAEDIEIVGTASNGKIALQKIPQLNPDIITLDIEMPEMDGLETLKEIKKLHPKIPVIMFSTLSERGAKVTMQALYNGAADYCTKPANVGNVRNSIETVRDTMLEKIRALIPGHHAPSTTTTARSTVRAGMQFKSSVLKTTNKRTQGFDIAVIGVSTGGPNALNELIPKIPGDFPLPILIVQHMPPIFTKILADRLDNQSPLSVSEAKEGDPVIPGHIYIAPGDFHMIIKKRATGYTVALNQEEPENSCRPAVDPLFRSAAKHFEARVLSIVLTGMGYDGQLGGEVVKKAGGYMLAQDKASSVVWGMPGAVVNAELADEVLPLIDLPTRINALARQGSKTTAYEVVNLELEDRGNG
jgi:two-component system chemotaxis response regulator CheB